MWIKLGIIAAVLILGGMMFSTEITELFPSTSALLADSLKNDINALNEKVTNSAENRLDTSIDKTIQSVSDSVYQGITETGDKLVENVNEKISEGITETGDKLVENVNEKISEGITETGDNIKTQIVKSSESSKEILVNEVSGFDPFSFIKNIFKIN
jgi:thermostable 8-oxoguanine DNA glycosylase